MQAAFLFVVGWVALDWHAALADSLFEFADHGGGAPASLVL
jgi:hypothetical protein